VNSVVTFVASLYRDGYKIANSQFINDTDSRIRTISFTVSAQQDVTFRVDSYPIRMYGYGCLNNTYSYFTSYLYSGLTMVQAIQHQINDFGSRIA
jgi:hypothetical protein